MVALLFSLVALAQPMTPPPDHRSEPTKPASCVVPLTLKRERIRLIANHTDRPFDEVRIDIAIPLILENRRLAPEWSDRQVAILPATEEQKIQLLVVEGLQVDQEAHVAFASGIRRTTTGIIVKVFRQRDRVVVDLRPVFAFEEWRSYPLTAKGIGRAHADITQLAAADSKPVIHQQGNNTVVLVNPDEPASTSLARELQAIARYAKERVAGSEVYVRIYAGEETIEVRRN